jgi:hypothetical protein
MKYLNGDRTGRWTDPFVYQVDSLKVCFIRTSLPAERQLSDIPEEGEGGVSWFTHDDKGKPLQARRETVSGAGGRAVVGQ